MTDATSSFMPSHHEAAQAKPEKPYRVENAQWGYVVSGVETGGRSLAAAQMISMLIGASFLAGAISLWLFPALTFGADALFMRYFATIVFVSMAFLFLWYASRGARSEIHIDVEVGEIREVIRNKTGRQTLMGSYAFEAVSAVEMIPHEMPGECDLVLRYRDTGGSLIVASGMKADLCDLHERLDRDIVPPSLNDDPEQAAA